MSTPGKSSASHSYFPTSQQLASSAVWAPQGYELALQAAHQPAGSILTINLLRDPTMDIRKVKKLIELLEESNIDEIEIKEGEESVRISRNGAQADGMAPAAPMYAPMRRQPAAPALRHLRQPPLLEAAPAAEAESLLNRQPTANNGEAPLWSAPSTAAPSPTSPAFHRSRPDCQCRRRDLHRRGHEDDEPDRSRQVRHHRSHPG